MFFKSKHMPVCIIMDRMLADLRDKVLKENDDGQFQMFLIFTLKYFNISYVKHFATQRIRLLFKNP